MCPIIRKATLADLYALSTLLTALFSLEDEFSPNSENQITGLKQLLTSDTGDVFVSVLEDKIIGMVTLQYLISTALGGKVAILEDMIILDEYRNYGYGSALLSFVTETAKNNNILRITLLTDNSNSKAIRFYEEIGFKKSSMLPMRLIF